MSSEPKTRGRARKWLGATVLAGAVSAVAGFAVFYDFGPGVALKLDEEETDKNGQVFNPSTQSLNRYASSLRELDRLLAVELSEDGRHVSFEIGSKKKAERLFARNIDIRFLVPLLPYKTAAPLDDFDRANLMLGEYARNGINLSYQDSNSLFGYFNASGDLFEDNAEDYTYTNGLLKPNARAKPRRFSVTNNCLKPGLWEFAAKDTVGEMYHSWFKMPQNIYFSMIRNASGIDIADGDLSDALSYNKDLSDVPLRLERLREAGKVLLDTQPAIMLDKKVGAYSSQDSRRKVQKGYFFVERDGKRIQPGDFTQMRQGDMFKVRKFVAPGVYSESKFEAFPYNPNWARLVIREVQPLTRYPGGREADDPFGYIEIALYERGEKRGVVVGNIPLSLLVEQEDYQLPAFGIGVLQPSTNIERRYLRLKEGPVPHYAYQITKNDEGNWALLNNHEYGLEQVYLRPFRKDGGVALRIILVSYERIVDLIELEVKLEAELAEKIKSASDNYKPPLFRVYEDANII